MDAPGFFAPVQNGAKVIPELRYNVFGATVGGPIKRDKIFFFFSYEGQRLRTGGTDTLTVPTAAQRAGDLSQLLNAQARQIPVYDPATTVGGNGATRTQFPNNIIPANRIDPVAAKLLTFYPLPNRAPDNVTGANNFARITSWRRRANFYMPKVDHNLSERDRITGRYIWNGGASAETSVFADPGADPRNTAENQQQYVYGSWTRTINPTTVNDLRFTYHLSQVPSIMSAGLGGDYPDKDRPQGCSGQRVSAVRAGGVQRPGDKRAGAAAVSDRAASDRGQFLKSARPACPEVRRGGAPLPQSRVQLSRPSSGAFTFAHDAHRPARQRGHRQRPGFAAARLPHQLSLKTQTQELDRSSLVPGGLRAGRLDHQHLR